MLLGLWLLFFGLLLLAILAYSIKRIFQYFQSRNKSFLLAAAKPWFYVFALFAAMFGMNWLFTPVPITKNVIVGEYEIDPSFYPGPNADWQKANFRFKVNPDDHFVFYVRLADQSEKEYVGTINWAHETPEKWSITIKDPHHAIDLHPVLYRGGKHFYYVFRSQRFGNMFFRKVVN